MTHNELLSTHSRLVFKYAVPIPPTTPDIALDDLKIWFTDDSFTVCPIAEKVNLQNCVFEFPHYVRPGIAFECPLSEAEPTTETVPIKVQLHSNKIAVTAQHAMYVIYRSVKKSEINVLKLENKKIPFNDKVSLSIYGANRGVFPLSEKSGLIYSLKQDRASRTIAYEPIIAKEELMQLCIEAERRPECLNGLNYPFTTQEFISLINKSLPK